MPPWTAIGRINIAGYRFTRHCTGFLVAPGLAVTAAHCLFHKRSGKPLVPSGLHFLPGWNRDGYKAHATGRCVRLMSGFRYNWVPTFEHMQTDVALVVLNKAVGLAPVPLAARTSLPAGTPLVHAGYSRDRQHVLTGDFTCSVVEEHKDVVLTDCDTNFGASGGPVFVRENGELQVAAVMSGSFKGKYTVAVKVAALRELLRETACR